MNIIILWTDALIYLLVIFIFLGLINIYRDKYASKKWRNIFKNKLNVVSVMILTCYFTLGFLDTVHLRDKDFSDQNTSGTISLLDFLLKPLPESSEKTFSAPFATHLFSKEAITLNDGKVVRDYPRLKFGGAHLKNVQDKWRDIGQRTVMVLLEATLITAAFAILLLFFRSRFSGLTLDEYLKSVYQGTRQFPWKTFFLTFWLLLFLLLWLAALAPYYHILGTNEVGDDVLYNAIKSIRTGLIIGTVTTLITLPFAILFGIAAGYFRGKTDDVVQYTYTLLSSIPAVLLIAAAVMTLQLVFERHPDWFATVAHRSDARLLALCAILGVTSWTGLCRLLRAETLKLTQIDFVQAARALGASHISIIFKHLLPNVFHIIIITIILDFSGLVLAEAVLSYVGVGVDPSTMSWGTMINSARLEMARVPVVWWNLTAAFIFMFILVLAANIFSDAIRDAYDPRMQRIGAL